MLIRPRFTDRSLNLLLWKFTNLRNHLRYEWVKYKAALRAITPALLGGSLGMEGSLKLRVIRRDGSVEDYGIVSRRVITRAGVDLIVKDFAGFSGNDVTIMNFHGTGSGTTPEASTDIGLVSEFTTELNPANTRPAGLQSNPATSSDEYFYSTVATTQYGSTVAITEHGLFSQASTGGGVMLDRSVFAVINLDNGNSLQTTYTLKLTAGG